MRIFNVMAVAAAGMLALVSCQNNDCKFNAKEYAERKTDKIDQIVELDDAQEKAVYAIYLEEGKQIKENIKAWEKQKGEMKHPDCKGPKAECDKKACDKKAECKKAECDKVECKKAECTKAACDKKADCKKAECGQPTPPRHHRHMISPKVRKETFQKIDALLTPEQQAKLKEHFAQRKACAPKAEQCCPTQTKCEQNK